MRSHNGFTLIEMVIVISIIALLAGGVIAGRALLHNSELQNVIVEYQYYSTAIHNFKTKYNAMPGDYASASETWDAATGCTNGIWGGMPTNLSVCNGNGDGYIQMTGPFEHILAWRHLGISGFINEGFQGYWASGGVCANNSNYRMDIAATHAINGRNVPRSKLKGAMWNLAVANYNAANYSGTAPNIGQMVIPMNPAIDKSKEHFLRLGGTLQDDNSMPNYSCSQSQIPIIKADEALQIDLKNDDGQFDSGRIRGMYNNLTAYNPCDGTSSDTGDYSISTAGINCSLAFKID